MNDLSKPLQYQGLAVMTLKQLDRLNGASKGTAFRAFKRHRDRLREGVDYFHITPQSDPAFLEKLRREGWIYKASTGAVLITESGYEQLRS